MKEEEERYNKFMKTLAHSKSLPDIERFNYGLFCGKTRSEYHIAFHFLKHAPNNDMAIKSVERLKRKLDIIQKLEEGECRG